MPLENADWTVNAEITRKQQRRRQRIIPYLLLHRQLKIAWLRAQVRDLVVERQMLRRELLEANRHLRRLPISEWEHAEIIKEVKKERDLVSAYWLLLRLMNRRAQDERAAKRRERRRRTYKGHRQAQ